jgi:chromatin remodeling complex protein RSC6
MQESIPNNEHLKSALHVMLQRANLSVSTKRTMRQELETTLLLHSGSLNHLKKEIGEWIDDYLQVREKENQDSPADESVERELKLPRLVPALADFVGTNQMAMSDVARKIWEHILENKLQVIWANNSVVLPARSAWSPFLHPKHHQIRVS